MKYKSMTKQQRNDLLIEYHRSHPELSLEELGKIFGISKQRVHYILKREERKKAKGSNGAFRQGTQAEGLPETVATDSIMQRRQRNATR